MDMRVKLGVQARDVITGFEGIVIARAEYLFGCAQWGLTSKVDEKGEAKTQYIDEGRVVYVGPGVRPEDVTAASGNGGPRSDAPGSVL